MQFASKVAELGALKKDLGIEVTTYDLSARPSLLSVGKIKNKEEFLALTGVGNSFYNIAPLFSDLRILCRPGLLPCQMRLSCCSS